MAPPTPDESEPRAGEARGGRISALIYDPFLWWGERAGMAERRRKLVSLARGRVLELGAGTGLNLDHYPVGLDRLVLAEPEPNMVKRLERRRERLGRRAEIVRAAAEALPFEDDSFDTVVSTFVLCTVSDLTRALDEVRRVLRPNGSLLFVEHVRSDDPGLARWQDRLHGAWHGFADGCNCNRQTADVMRGAGHVISLTERAAWRRMPSIVRPLIIGSATPVR